MVFAAAGLAGLGGLLLQLVLVRRHGLLLGNTAEAAALVLALFLLGLGVGGLYGPRGRIAGRRPLGTAAVAYALVAVTAVSADNVLAGVGPVNWVSGVLLALWSPGLPTLCMGAAFPLLFSALPPGSHPVRGGVLIAVNLLGAVVGTFWGGNFGIPELGLSRCTWLAAGAYGVAALLVAVRSRRERGLAAPERPPLPGVGWAEGGVFAAGLLLLGLEVYMLRRLPFFLDGFQPTLTGVVTACLVGLTLGAAVGTPLLLRLFHRRAVAMSIVLAVAALALGMHEWLAETLGRMDIRSDLGFHLRILASAAAAAGLPCFFLGATIPLCLKDYVHPETRAPLAGRLFFFEGLGALCGAMLVGHLLPAVWPGGFFVLALPAIAVVALALVHRRHPALSVAGLAVVLVLAVTGASGAGSLLAPAPPIRGSRYDRAWYRPLAHKTDSVLSASVVYDPQKHSMMLFTDEFRAAYSGPATGYMKVLAHLPFLLRNRQELERLAVIALGTGTTANAVTLWPDPQEMHVVEVSPAVVELVDHFAGAGPGQSAAKRARFRADRRCRLHVTDGRRFVARRPAGSLDLISMEPLLPYAPGTVPLYTREFYQLCGRALSRQGLMVQWVPTHAMPREFYRTLLRTFAESFRHHSLWLFDQSTLLVGSKKPHLPSLDELELRLQAAPEGARRDLHEAGIASATDLALAFIETGFTPALEDAPLLWDDRPFLERIGYWSGQQRLEFFPQNLAVLLRLAASGVWPGEAGSPEQIGFGDLRRLRLAARLELARGRPAAALSLAADAQSWSPQSVLLHREVCAALRQLWVTRILAGGGTVAEARRYLERDPGCAEVHGLLALRASDPDERRQKLRDADAVDPVFARSQPVFLPLASEPRGPGPLEQLAVLPADPELAAAASTPGPRGLALRARFPVAVAYALLDSLETRPLTPVERRALRSVLDPQLLVAAVHHVVTRKGSLAAEVLPMWRRDLPMPPGLGVLAKGAGAERRQLAAALGGRRSAPARAVLADLLLDPDVLVRTAASVSLFQGFGDRISYDPEWPESRRRKAAAALRKLHNQPR